MFASKQLSKIILFLICIIAHKLNAETLIDVRTGYHGQFSRVVLQFDQPVQYRVSPGGDTPSIKLIVDKIHDIRLTGKVIIERDDPILQAIDYRQTGAQLDVSISLKTKSVSIRQQSINWPFRVVIDIYQNNPAAEKVSDFENTLAQNQIAEHETAASGDTDPLAQTKQFSDSLLRELLPAIAVASPTVDFSKPIVDLPKPAVKKSAGEKRKTVDQLENPAPENESSFRLIWVICIVFLIADAFLLLFYLKKKYERKPAAPKQQKQAVATPFSVQEQPIEKTIPPQPDSDAQTKFNLPPVGKPFEQQDKLEDHATFPAEKSPEEFLGMLQSAVRKNSQASVMTGLSAMKNDSAALKRAEKLDSLINSLSQATQIEKRPASAPPEFREIVKELYPEAITDELSEEEVRNELIGRDGIEFMRNIKRLHVMVD